MHFRLLDEQTQTDGAHTWRASKCLRMHHPARLSQLPDLIETDEIAACRGVPDCPKLPRIAQLFENFFANKQTQWRSAS